MQCPRCGTAFPPPTPGREPRLRCHTCGARLFAWLGDHFGVHDAVAAQDGRSDGVQWWMLLLVACFVLLALSCLCLAGATS